jgi:5-bromo-4-chloroindolyl phosphate hydrolysis protein
MELKKRLANLLTVKSIVTIIVTIVFAYLSVIGIITADQFMTVFMAVIAFYFGTQNNKKESADKAGDQ